MQYAVQRVIDSKRVMLTSSISTNLMYIVIQPEYHPLVIMVSLHKFRAQLCVTQVPTILANQQSCLNAQLRIKTNCGAKKPQNQATKLQVL